MSSVDDGISVGGEGSQLTKGNLKVEKAQGSIPKMIDWDANSTEI
jgi:hypothetical protein